MMDSLAEQVSPRGQHIHTSEIQRRQCDWLVFANTVRRRQTVWDRREVAGDRVVRGVLAVELQALEGLAGGTRAGPAISEGQPRWQWRGYPPPL